MTVGRYSLTRSLTESDAVGEFSCGTDSPDEYLHRRALANHVSGGARCFVTTSEQPERVVGYYALAMTSVQREDVARKVKRDMPQPIPAMLLGRLAVDSKHRGQGLGQSLLRDAILRTIRVAEEVGVRVLLTHAHDDIAASFYGHFDFEPSPTNDLHMMLLLKDARAAIAGHGC